MIVYVLAVVMLWAMLLEGGTSRENRGFVNNNMIKNYR